MAKFKRFAINVWDVNPEEKTDEQIAAEDLERMEAYMKELGLAMKLKEPGVTEDMLARIADSTLIMNGGYKVLIKDGIIDILKKSM